MFLHGMYRLAEEWRLDRELRKLRDDALRRRQQQPLSQSPAYDPLTAFDDRPATPEPLGLAVLPLDSDWSPAPVSMSDATSDSTLDSPATPVDDKLEAIWEPRAEPVVEPSAPPEAPPEAPPSPPDVP
jgi:hypothetical protein